ncbi:hypothetical protein DTO013F2_10594 [Penicillium roqueforti]|nr:hypothetical protein DTO013F2_10594 [Penicillium roqueforti]
MPETLSTKDHSLFRQVVHHFEMKQYKKGIKIADQVLRKNPKHGDTQAMKALNMSQIGQLEDAFALAKKALQNDMKSHITWHVYGLLLRQEKNYEEAIKAYRFALRLEPESQPIQRDLALLQMQMRDYQGYIRSRKHLEAVGYRCTDVLAVMEMKADYLLRLDRKAEAEGAYTALLERNPDNSIYYNGLIKAKDIPESDHKALKALYDEWVKKNPRCDAARRIPLDFLEGDDFKQAADVYLQRMLKKGVPSLFVNIKQLYVNPAKRDVPQPPQGHGKR